VNVDQPQRAIVATRRASARVSARALLASLRPRQWTKNAVVFAALVFADDLFHLRSLAIAALAALCFCLVSSATYLVNDLQDIESDRLHPTKRFRPIPAGQVSPHTAWATIAILLALSVPVAFAIRPAFAGIIAIYLLLMTAYTFFLKHMVIVDVFAISGGFVLRAAGGAVALSVPISPWLYVCTILLSLFIGFGKRRHELLLLEHAAGSHRRNLDEYSALLLDHFIQITAAATVMAYSLYTFVAPNLPASHAMMLTIPFVLYATFRYLFLLHRRDGGGSPEQLLLTDRPLLTSIALWGLACVAILYGPWS
jgi:4-hydroxybenzoate polyprenyltransferase